MALDAKLVSDLLGVPLHNQYACARSRAKPIMLKRKCGSGIGRLMSSLVSSVTLMKKAELGFVSREDIKSKYSIRFYFRYEDDLIVALGCSREMRIEFAWGFNECCNPRQVLVEEVSCHSVQLLDMKVNKCADGLIKTIPYVKPGP